MSITTISLCVATPLNIYKALNLITISNENHGFLTLNSTNKEDCHLSGFDLQRILFKISQCAKQILDSVNGIEPPRDARKKLIPWSTQIEELTTFPKILDILLKQVQDACLSEEWAKEAWIDASDLDTHVPSISALCADLSKLSGNMVVARENVNRQIKERDFYIRNADKVLTNLTVVMPVVHNEIMLDFLAGEKSKIY